MRKMRLLSIGILAFTMAFALSAAVSADEAEPLEETEIIVFAAMTARER